MLHTIKKPANYQKHSFFFLKTKNILDALLTFLSIRAIFPTFLLLYYEETLFPWQMVIVTGMAECESKSSQPSGRYSRIVAVCSQRFSLAVAWSVVGRFFLVACCRCMGQQLSRLLARGFFPNAKPPRDTMPYRRSQISDESVSQTVRQFRPAKSNYSEFQKRTKN